MSGLVTFVVLVVLFIIDRTVSETPVPIAVTPTGREARARGPPAVRRYIPGPGRRHHRPVRSNPSRFPFLDHHKPTAGFSIEMLDPVNRRDYKDERRVLPRSVIAKSRDRRPRDSLIAQTGHRMLDPCSRDASWSTTVW